MMKSISLTCRIVTPLFMGGAEQQAELRTQSFNGLFRYWFRLLGGSLEDEKRLFGWGGEDARKGLVRLFIMSHDNLRAKTFEKVFDERGMVRNDRGINYIGFSLDPRFRKDQKGRKGREYLEKNAEFSLVLRFHPTSTDEDIKKFLCAVWCAFYLGNFGSRSRRGFGSIMVKDINGCVPQNFELNFSSEQDIGGWLRSQLEYIGSLNYWRGREDIPRIFDNLEIYRVNKNNLGKLQSWINEVQSGRSGKHLVKKWGLGNVNSGQDLLDFMGFLLMAYRSYYQPDYGIAKSIIQKRVTQNQTIKRVAFGLPLNFYFSSIERGAQVSAKLKHESLRRASPLTFKIIESKSGNFEGFIMLFRPTDRDSFKFLPDGARISLSDVNLDQPNWQILDDFINSLKSKNLVTKIYPQGR